VKSLKSRHLESLLCICYDNKYGSEFTINLHTNSKLITNVFIANITSCYSGHISRFNAMYKTLFLSVFLFSTIVTPTHSLAQYQSANNLSLVGQWNETFGGTPANIDIKDNYVYLAAGNDVQFYDISNPDEPLLINHITFKGLVSKLKITESADSMYVLSNRLYLYDISNLNNPFLLKKSNRLHLNGYHTNLRITDNMAFVGAKEVLIYDLNQPDSINYIGNLEFNSLFISDILEYDNIEYLLVSHLSGTHFINISDPLNPVVVSELKAEGKRFSTYGVVFKESYAYSVYQPINENIFNGTPPYFGLAIWDVSEPDQPEEMLEIKFSSPDLRKLEHTDDLLFMSEKNLYDRTEKITVINISDPISPVFISRLILPTSMSDIDLYNDQIWTTSSDSVYRFNFSNPSDPFLANSFSNAKATLDVFKTEIVGNYAISAIKGLGLKFIDITYPHKPTTVNTLEISSDGFQITTDQQSLFFNESMVIHELDARDFTNLDTLSSIEIPGNQIYELVSSPPYLIACSDDVVIIDYSERSSPHIESILPTANGCIDISIQNNVLSYNYRANRYDLTTIPNDIIELFDLTALQPLLTIDKAPNGSLLYEYDFSLVQIIDDKLYLVSESSIVYMYDISDPKSPEFKELLRTTIVDLEHDNGLIFTVQDHHSSVSISTYDYNFEPVVGSFSHKELTDIMSQFR